MPDDRNKNTLKSSDSGPVIAQAMNAAVRDAVLQHKQKGLPIVVWRDGKVAWIPPEEIVIPPDESSMPFGQGE